MSDIESNSEPTATSTSVILYENNDQDDFPLAELQQALTLTHDTTLQAQAPYSLSPPRTISTFCGSRYLKRDKTKPIRLGFGAFTHIRPTPAYVNTNTSLCSLSTHLEWKFSTTFEDDDIHNPVLELDFTRIHIQQHAAESKEDLRPYRLATVKIVARLCEERAKHSWPRVLRTSSTPASLNEFKRTFSKAKSRFNKWGGVLGGKVGHTGLAGSLSGNYDHQRATAEDSKTERTMLSSHVTTECSETKAIVTFTVCDGRHQVNGVDYEGDKLPKFTFTPQLMIDGHDTMTVECITIWEIRTPKPALRPISSVTQGFAMNFPLDVSENTRRSYTEWRNEKKFECIKNAEGVKEGDARVTLVPDVVVTATRRTESASTSKVATARRKKSSSNVTSNTSLSSSSVSEMDCPDGIENSLSRTVRPGKIGLLNIFNPSGGAVINSQSDDADGEEDGEPSTVRATKDQNLTMRSRTLGRIFGQPSSSGAS